MYALIGAVSSGQLWSFLASLQQLEANHLSSVIEIYHFRFGSRFALTTIDVPTKYLAFQMENDECQMPDDK
jgi:hypothetical protein